MQYDKKGWQNIIYQILYHFDLAKILYFLILLMLYSTSAEGL